MERGSLAEKYFKIMIVQMTQDLGKGWEVFIKDLEELKHKQR